MVFSTQDSHKVWRTGKINLVRGVVLRNVYFFKSPGVQKTNMIYNTTVEPGIRDTQETVQNCREFWGLALFLRSIAIYWICLGTEVTILSFQVVPISQVVLKTGFTVI